MKSYDIIIIGAGIIGLATAMELAKIKGISLLVVEKENRLAAHQTGNNSGVIHSGLYYKPGSLKALNCTMGREQLYDFCQEYNIAHERCGKIVVAVSEYELDDMKNLLMRGEQNGLTGITMLTSRELGKHEPHVAGVAGLFIPHTGIVDYTMVASKFSEVYQQLGGEISLSSEVINIIRKNGELSLKTTSGDFIAQNLINCAGLQSDRIGKMCSIDPGMKIVPFRGEYYKLRENKQHLVKNLIYPVPDPNFPFLGVHFTRMQKGGVEAGPNAVLSFKREGYKKLSFSAKDNFDLISYQGFWKMGAKHWKMGLGEMYRSLNKSAFTKALQRLIPEIKKSDLVPGGAGVRAQALEPNGDLVDDFRIRESQNMVHVFNAPSPAATASINIGKTIAKISIKNFDLN